MTSVTADGVLRTIVRPALLTGCPAAWRGPAAERMLLAIGLQESRLIDRDQLDAAGRPGRLGPALGLWQCELGNAASKGGLWATLRHPACKDVLADAARRIGLGGALRARWEALAVDDAWACIVARGLLRTVPEALPGPEQTEEAWRQYLWAWRPGKPRPEKWSVNWSRAVAAAS